MSGLLRRIKRSRTAGAGDHPAEEQAAGPEGAPTTAEAEAGASAADTGAPASSDATAELPAATAPAIKADPDTPAGLDPREAAPRPAGRRGRLRRRLRYLRRARELMLRDLGGLVYEVHRSGDGDFGRHATVIGGKVERLSTLDAEAGAIEEALGAPRSETVVFQPGVGGVCDVCGELYGSAARFCSHCGSATDPAARPAPEATTAEPRPVPPMPKPPGAAADERSTEELATGGTAAVAAADQPAADAATADEATAHAAAADATTADDPAAGAPTTDEPAAGPPTTDEPATDEPTADEPAAGASTTDDSGEPKRGDQPGDPGRNPFSGISNGRPDDEAPPELSSGDPLATRESRQ